MDFSDIQRWVASESSGVAVAVGLIATACVVIVWLALRGTNGDQRADILHELAGLVRALWFGRGPRSRE